MTMNVSSGRRQARDQSLTIEEGGSTSYTLVLLAQPTGTVRVQVDDGPEVVPISASNEPDCPNRRI